jgi:hypothetical protein
MILAIAYKQQAGSEEQKPKQKRGVSSWSLLPHEEKLELANTLVDGEYLVGRTRLQSDPRLAGMHLPSISEK